MYANIRTFKRRGHIKAFDGDERFVTSPPSPPGGGGPHNGFTPTSYYGWQVPNSTIVDDFSATCWMFGQELTDIAVDKNTTPPVLGLIQSSWGGTIIDFWLKNDTISRCKNATGGPEPVAIGHGGAWNGMVAPFINYTIFGVLWYQGENNVGYVHVPTKHTIISCTHIPPPLSAHAHVAYTRSSLKNAHGCLLWMSPGDVVVPLQGLRVEQWARKGCVARSWHQHLRKLAQQHWVRLRHEESCHDVARAVVCCAWHYPGNTPVWDRIPCCWRFGRPPRLDAGISACTDGVVRVFARPDWLWDGEHVYCPGVRCRRSELPCARSKSWWSYLVRDRLAVPSNVRCTVSWAAGLFGARVAVFHQTVRHINDSSISYFFLYKKNSRNADGGTSDIRTGIRSTISVSSRLR